MRLGATPQHGVTTCPTHRSCTMKLQTVNREVVMSDDVIHAPQA